MIRVFEAFSGYGSQRMALDNLGIEHEVVAISEIDKFAIKSYEAIHGETNNLGDISKIKVEDIPDHDLFTYSFPCQDISVAGKQEGFDKGSGTRSGLLWECERIISSKKPKYLLMENVKNLVGKKFMGGFQEWIDYLESVGYSNYWQVLNAKDYGIPQNRERVFLVSILGEHEPFEFPKPTKLEKRLKDILEPEVDEKYYLSTERSKQLISTITDGGADNEPKLRQIARYDTETRKNSNRFRTYDPNGLSPALNTMGGGGLEPHIPESKIEPERILGIFDKENSTKDKIAPTLDTMQGGWRQPSIIVESKIAASRGRNKENPSDRTKGIELEQRLEVNENGTSNALTTVQKDNYVVEPKIIDNLYANREPRVYDETSPSLRAERHGLDAAEPRNNDNVIDQYRIRKLTPLECWRLMGVKDELFYKAQEVNSNSQLYKQAGNSIVVQVLERIFEKMFKEDLN